MKKIFLIIISFALLYTGCETIDFGDTNKDVNAPSEANTNTLMQGAISRYSSLLQGRDYCITPTLYVQYFVQYVYNDEMLYANTASVWIRYYVQTLSSLQEIINICSDEETAASSAVTVNGDANNQLAVAMILKSFIFKRVTDNFGDVPYSAALSTESLTPVYDKQEDIYAGLIADVKAARDMIDVTAEGAAGDIIYYGDMAKWVKFANSFLMTLALQLSEVDTDIDAQGVFTEALNHSGGVMDSLEDEAYYTPDIDNGWDNPWSWMRSADYGLSQELISSLKGKGDNKVTSNTTFDERLLFLIEDQDTSKIGEPYGYENYSGSQVELAPVLIDPGTSLPLANTAYSYLNRAEAAARGWTTEDEGAMLTAAIKASYASFNALYNDGSVEMTDGTGYATARVSDMETAAGGALQVIAEEKWVGLLPMGFEAWSEWRRTDYPKLTPAADAYNDGSIPTRYKYPTDESTLNASGYASGVASLSPASDDNTSKVWWDQ